MTNRDNGLFRNDVLLAQNDDTNANDGTNANDVYLSVNDDTLRILDKIFSKSPSLLRRQSICKGAFKWTK